MVKQSNDLKRPNFMILDIQKRAYGKSDTYPLVFGKVRPRVTERNAGLLKYYSNRENKCVKETHVLHQQAFGQCLSRKGTRSTYSGENNGPD